MVVGVTVWRYTQRVRLDRYDSYLRTFHASVTEQRHDGRGTWLRLDRSAFYPQAGGQPHDVGSLLLEGKRLEVVEVQADADDEVWHLLSAPSPTAGAPELIGAALVGEIDWPRRWRHMQRHSAQHMLSAALVRVDPAFGTLAVSMRGPDCTIEVAGEMTPQQLMEVEGEVNRAARENYPITAFEVAESRLGEYALRRPAKASGLVRLVAMGQYDLVACGGTHLRSTAETLPIKVLGVERVRGSNSRLTFRAGEEASEDHAVKHTVVTRLGQLLSAPVTGLPERAERLNEEVAVANREADAWRSLLATKLAAELAEARSAPHAPLVAVLEGQEAALLTDLMEACQRLDGVVALLAAAAPGQAQLAFVAGPGANVDVRPLLSAAIAELGGRGGGRHDRAQGAAQASAEQVRAVLAGVAASLAGD